ncbi:MAG: GntR family transcriptional regulator [Rhodovibrionaceae bacterium]
MTAETSQSPHFEPRSSDDDAADVVVEPAGRSLNERIYNEIKQLILTNKMRQGHKLGHWELAQLLKVSRTPVREALERLLQEGYVKHIPRRGYFVAEIDAVEAKNLYQTREALEIFALQLTLERGLRPEQLRELEEIEELYANLIETRRTNERGRQDRDFHLRLASFSDNDYIVRSLGAIFERLLLKRRADGYHSDRGSEALREHKQLLEALRNRDDELAVATLRGHIRKAWTAFEEHLADLAR